MAHNIWRDSTGMDHMFLAGKREDAWHLLGQRVDKAATWEEAMKLAGLDWEIAKVQQYARSTNGKVIPVPLYAIFRKTDGEYLGTVGPETYLKQNRELFKYLDVLVEREGGAHYDSAGALGNGAKIWISMRVPSMDMNILGVDKHTMYLVFATAHDNSMQHTTFMSDTRVVCQNTLDMALNNNSAIVRWKHTKNQNQRFDRAKDLISGSMVDSTKLKEKLEALARRKMTGDTMMEVFNRLFPKTEKKTQEKNLQGVVTDKVEEVSSTKRDNVLLEVLKLYESNDNNAIPEVRGTAYNLLNAVTEYTDHIRGTRLTNVSKDDPKRPQLVMQARAENAVIGSGAALKLEALQVLEEVCANNPIHDPRVFAMPKPVESVNTPILDSIISDDELNQMYGSGD